MVCESMPDEAEALVIIGKQRAKYEIKINRNCTVKMLDKKILDVMVNQFIRDHESSEFVPLQNFIIKMWKFDLGEIDYDECNSRKTVNLSNYDAYKKIKDLKERFNIDNIKGYEYVFYIQRNAENIISDLMKRKRNWYTNSDIERILDEHNLKNCEKTNCANDENDKLNDVDIKNNDTTSDDTNKKDIFCTAFPEYSVKKQDSSSIDSDDKEPSTTKFIFSREDRVPRGLVNQAMTCYLNSLLQALYMTPEFRNALYKWEYVESPDNDENMSIPFQLQKLFLNLQTSEKSSVETTSLTKSFGWDSSEAWQQHDIQELCRVMFDALEHQFKNTEQANLINQFYEGKMIDYVKCLECNTEKTREDTFLDIPLPVRPFNSNVAYNSIEDALKAFVKYELLEGNNQYHCEKCDKKCDAHKGLKFNKFPYLVTLHLKRFDFDCHSFHRIKLNDKVTFPETLDLNPFIDSADSLSGQENNCQENDLKMDNGVSPDECSPCDENAVENIHGNEEPNDDKGIDATNDNCVVTEPKGPYVYELFAIMIHSGSASGGHYYAYIKDFTTQEWFCYNDQSVSRITNEDIKKTYGGGPARTTYYSSAYNTSTNAYMLMYRQIDPKINAVPMQKEDFPDHIKKLLPKLKEENSNSHRICNTMTVYLNIPKSDATLEAKVPCLKFATWGDVVAQAQLHFDDYKHVDTSLIKVYEFDYDTKTKLSSLNHQSLVSTSVSSIIIEPPQESMTCELSIIELDVDEKRAMGPMETKPMKKSMTIGKLKRQIADGYINWNSSEMVIAKQSNEDFEMLKDDTMLSQLSRGLKLYVGNKLDPRPLIDFSNSKFCELCRTYSKLIYIQVRVPDINYDVLAESGILPLKEPSSPMQKTETDCTEASNDLEQESKVTLKETDVNNVPSSTLQLSEIDDRNTPEQSNSEDSSLSDSDRTLIAEPAENNEDEDEVFRVYQKDEGCVNSENETCYGLWISQVSDVESKLKKVVESFIHISSEYIQIINICSAETYPAQYSVYSVNIERKPQDDEMKFRVINLNDVFAAEPTCDKTKFEVIMMKNETVKDLKEKIIRLLKIWCPIGYGWCNLWVINNHLEEDDREVYMKEDDQVSQYHRPISGRKHGFDHRTIDIAMYPHRSDSFKRKNVYEIDIFIPVFVRRIFPYQKRYDIVEIVVVPKSMKNFVEELSQLSKIPQEHLLFINFSTLEQLRSSGSTFPKNINPWTELLYKSKDHARWSSAEPKLSSAIDVIIYRDSREEYPSDMNRMEYEIFQDRPKMRKNYRDYSTTDSSREIRRTSIRSSMSRPEKGIKIQVSPNK